MRPGREIVGSEAAGSRTTTNRSTTRVAGREARKIDSPITISESTAAAEGQIQFGCRVPLRESAGLKHQPVTVEGARIGSQAAERRLDVAQLGIVRDLGHDTPSRSLNVVKPAR